MVDGRRKRKVAQAHVHIGAGSVLKVDMFLVSLYVIIIVLRSGSFLRGADFSAFDDVCLEFTLQEVGKMVVWPPTFETCTSAITKPISKLVRLDCTLFARSY